ncbi:MAG: hypothetical protein ACRDVP_10855 [Acidimicrobiales bacterium]
MITSTRSKGATYSEAPLAPSFVVRAPSRALPPRAKRDPDPSAPNAVRRRPLLVPEVAFAVICTGVSLYRFVLLYRHGRPTGADLGNWLDIGHFLLGNGLPNGGRSIYPPLVPYLAVGFVQVFGLVLGWALLATVCCAVPALATFWVLRRRGSVWAAVACGTLLLCTSSTAEAAAWGGYPQLIGLGGGLLLTASFDELIESPTSRTAWFTGGLLFVVAASSHLILAQIMPVLVIVLAIHLVRAGAGKRLQVLRALLRHVPRVIGPALALIPFYVWLLGSVGSTFVSQSSTSPLGNPAALLDNLWVIYRDNPVLWKTLLVLSLVVPILSWRSRRTPLWRLSTALIGGVILETSASSQARFVYLVPLAAAVALGQLVESIRTFDVRTRIGLHALGATWLGALAVAGLMLFPAQISYYGSFVRPGTVSGLDWIRTHTPANSLMLVAPINGEPFGWWVEGYGRRASLIASADEWLNVARERTRALEAVRLLSSPDVLSAPNLSADRRAGVTWIVLPTAWGGVTTAQLHGFENEHPHAVVFHNPALVVVQIPS